MKKVLLAIAAFTALSASAAPESNRPMEVQERINNMSSMVANNPGNCVTYAQRRDEGRDALTSGQMWQLGYCEAVLELAITEAMTKVKNPGRCTAEAGRWLMNHPERLYGSMKSANGDAYIIMRFRDMVKKSQIAMQTYCAAKGG